MDGYVAGAALKGIRLDNASVPGVRSNSLHGHHHIKGSGSEADFPEIHDNVMRASPNHFNIARADPDRLSVRRRSVSREG